MMATRADVTVRIDTELRAKAGKDQLNINMSDLFERALRVEIDRRETIAQTLEGSEVIKLDLEDKEGRRYVGRLTGKLLGEGHGVQAFLTDDERLIIYDAEDRAYHEDPDDFEAWFPHDFEVYTEIMHALGETPEIDI